MKTDRELLELAAKAAGLEFYLDSLCGGPELALDGMRIIGLCLANGGVWNPLTDDGDALRLAVNLRIVVDVTPWAADAHHWHNKRSDDSGIRHLEYNDPYAATRRAIVRAAAAIGESMP